MCLSLRAPESCHYRYRRRVRGQHIILSSLKCRKEYSLCNRNRKDYDRININYITNYHLGSTKNRFIFEITSSNLLLYSSNLTIFLSKWALFALPISFINSSISLSLMCDNSGVDVKNISTFDSLLQAFSEFNSIF